MTGPKVVNSTPGNKIKSQTEIESEAIRSNMPIDPSSLLTFKTDLEPEPESEVASIEDRDPEEIEARQRIEEFMKLPPEQRQAKMAIVLERGIIHDRLTVPNIPKDLHYEWVRNDTQEIDRMRTLGFWVDNNYANKRALNSDGTSSNQVGDVILMITTLDNKKMIDKVRMESQIRSANNPRESGEDADFISKTRRESGGDIPAFSESKQNTMTVNDVREAVARADAQTRGR